MAGENGVYFGIEINSKYTMISYYQQNMESPETISTIMGSENYQIPTVLAKRKGLGQFYFGDEAKRQAKIGAATLIDNFFDLAFTDQEIIVEKDVYLAKDLLVIFLKQVFQITGRTPASLPLKKLTICLDKVDLDIAETLSLVVTKLGIDPRKLMVIDYRECFYYYVLNQPPEIFLHDVCLFDFSDRELKATYLKRNINVRPQVVNILENNFGSLNSDRDSQFSSIIDEAFANKLVSCVYLLGDGFEGDWMKESLQKLCKNRRIFKGNNLYSKGACYAGFIKTENTDWPYVYIGDNELKVNVSLKVIDNNELKFHNLIQAGNNWYETRGECEVILDGEKEVEIWMHSPNSREAKVELLELTDLPDRDNRTTRLRISACPKSDTEILISIVDLGFGEIAPSSKKTWEHTITIS